MTKMIKNDLLWPKDVRNFGPYLSVWRNHQPFRPPKNSILGQNDTPKKKYKKKEKEAALNTFFDFFTKVSRPDGPMDGHTLLNIFRADAEPRRTDDPLKPRWSRVDANLSEKNASVQIILQNT